MNQFLQRHADRVTGVLHGFDRLRFRGTLRPLAHTGGMMEFLWSSQVLLKDFGKYVLDVSQQVRQAVVNLAERAGRPVKYLASSSTNKEEQARKIAAADGVREGLVCVLSCVEVCRSYEVYRNRETKHIELRNCQRKCLHQYVYSIHPRLGWMHARLQTWFPFDLRVYINGREWLCRELDREGVGYLRRENCLVQVSDVPRAQRLFNKQLRTRWPDLLDSIAEQVFPLRSSILAAWPMRYYWSLDESEWASDVMFRSAADLAVLYPRLIQHAMRSFGTREVLRFLGRKVPTQRGLYWGRFENELTSDLRQRPEGMRVKHRLGHNSLKMYDKQGSVLRIETTINCPRDMKAFRPKEGDECGPKAWRYLRKGVADIHRRAQLCQAVNDRYLQSLADVDETVALAQLVEPLCRPVRKQGQRTRALNPLSPEDALLLEAVNRGEFLIHGFRNRDLHPLLYGSQASSLEERRRRSAAVTRKIRLLRAHRLIRKVPNSHRYLTTPQGRLAIMALLAARQADPAKLTAAA